MKPSFNEWLAGREYDLLTVSSRKSDLKRLEKHYGDLDELYDGDRFGAMTADLQYSKDDERRDRPNPSNWKLTETSTTTCPISDHR